MKKLSILDDLFLVPGAELYAFNLFPAPLQRFE